MLCSSACVVTWTALFLLLPEARSAVVEAHTPKLRIHLGIVRRLGMCGVWVCVASGYVWHRRRRLECTRACVLCLCVVYVCVCVCAHACV